jgi:4-diphosphocytidyl-2-C-methyl-D-erythritol kinase
MTEYAYAKLNLSLDVTGRRDDGYHNMLMVMQTISVSDRIDLELTPEPGIQASCNFHYVPTDGRNLAVRAAEVYLQAVSAAQPDAKGVTICMEKHIPVGAGMAGGSADAAAVLRGMNRLFGSPLNRQELEALAGQVGSDVAFCVAGGTQLAKGRGEVLEDLPPLPSCRIVVCKPGFSISTPELFRKLDSVSLRRHPDTAGMLAALDNADLREIGIRMYNVFEDVPDRRMRQVGEIKSVLLDHGALGAMMTGTGSAVFGIFSDAAAAERCAADLKKEHRFCRVAEPVERITI